MAADLSGYVSRDPAGAVCGEHPVVTIVRRGAEGIRL
jgi:hypothetical protein